MARTRPTRSRSWRLNCQPTEAPFGNWRKARSLAWPSNSKVPNLGIFTGVTSATGQASHGCYCNLRPDHPASSMRWWFSGVENSAKVSMHLVRCAKSRKSPCSPCTRQQNNQGLVKVCPTRKDVQTSTRLSKCRKGFGSWPSPINWYRKGGF